MFCGGLTGQADAIKQGAARALGELSPDNRKPLKLKGTSVETPELRKEENMALKKLEKLHTFKR